MFDSINSLILKYASRQIIKVWSRYAGRRAYAEHLNHLRKHGFVNVDLKNYR